MQLSWETIGKMTQAEHDALSKRDKHLLAQWLAHPHLRATIEAKAASENTIDLDTISQLTPDTYQALTADQRAEVQRVLQSH